MAYTCDLAVLLPLPLLPRKLSGQKGSPPSGQQPAGRAALLLFHLMVGVRGPLV